MDSDYLFENSRVAAYHLWEATGGENTMHLWYCCEDIAAYFEENHIFDTDIIERILNLGIEDFSYISFMRNIAFRIYLYTGNENGLENWLSAEKILKNSEWVNAVIKMAAAYHEIRNNDDLSAIYSDQIKKYYRTMNF